MQGLQDKAYLRPILYIGPMWALLKVMAPLQMLSRVPTEQGNQGKIKSKIPVREKSGNLVWGQKVREFYYR